VASPATADKRASHSDLVESRPSLAADCSERSIVRRFSIPATALQLPKGLVVKGKRRARHRAWLGVAPPLVSRCLASGPRAQVVQVIGTRTDFDPTVTLRKPSSEQP
jgi:hypothetical protein